MNLNEETQNQEAGSKTATTQPKESLKSICQRSLDSLFDWLAEMRVPIILGLLCLFLYQPIEELAIKRLIAPVLAHFNTGWLSSIVALVLAVILVLRLIQLGRRRYIVGGKFVLSAGLILPAYLYYRLGPPDFEFYGLFGQTWTIAFADLIPLACFLTILLWAWAYCNTKRQARQKEQAAESVEGFLTDHPLTEEEEELSGWKSQAQTLTQKLLATDTTRAAFSLGIVASWGEGKSSFMGIMQRYLQQAHREVIVMHFNPWLYDKEAQLTKVFFEELRRTLAPYSSKLSKSIDNYTDLLLAVDSSWLKFAHQLLRLPQRSTAEQFDQLSRDIQELGKKVVIFIDDVDRLTREELLELFNLVRNSSNLPCLYFVLAYDKSYILKTLQSDGEHMSRYPEKILQEEYPLPKLAPDKVWGALKRCLQKQGDTEAARIIDTIYHQSNLYDINLIYHFRTIRMVKRVVNSFSSRYTYMKGYVDIHVLFIFELIYYAYPIVYEFLEEMYKAIDTDPDKQHSAFRIQSPSSHINLSFKSDTTSDSPSAKKEPQDNSYPVTWLIEQYWNKKMDTFNSYHLSNYTEIEIEELLKHLWDKDSLLSDELAHKPVGYWDRYFNRGLLEQDISDDDFKAFYRGTNRDIKKNIMGKWGGPKEEAFLKHINKYIPTSREEIEDMAWCIFYWNSIEGIQKHFLHNKIDELFARWAKAVQVKDAKAVQVKDAETVSKLLSSLLDDVDLAFGSITYVKGWLFEKNSTPQYLDIKGKLRSKQELILQNAVKSGVSTSELYTLWSHTSWPDEKTAQGTSRTERANELMRAAAGNDFRAFQECILITRRYPLPNPDYEEGETSEYGRYLFKTGFLLNPIPWNTLEEFRQFLSQYSNDTYASHFRKFLSKAIKARDRMKDDWYVDSEEWEPLR